MLTTRVISVITAASAAATQTSAALKALGARTLSVQATVTGGTATSATLALQGSNDGVSYVDITSVAIGASSTKILSIVEVPYVNIRVVYTFTSGTLGTVDAVVAVVESY